MASGVFNTKRLKFVPPDKGSFPLDHEGICKELMMKYMNCLNENNQKNTFCREEIKKYLDCRMNNELMAKEEWRKLGFSDDEEKFAFTENKKMSTSMVTSEDQIKFHKKNILLGCTGSVATIKIPVLVRKLTESGSFNVKVVATEHAKHFFTSEEIPGVEVITDSDEWNSWNKRGDPVVHIELCKWADLFLIAPLDANTLGKMAGGLCDNLLTCIARAWNMEKPLFFCPAMNTKMYEHPITSTQILTLVNWGYLEIPVTSKVLVCGDKGLGAMAEVDTIVQTVVNFLNGR